MSEYFVIKHVDTGMLMPQEVRSGFTKWNPEEQKADGFETIPRLFLSEKAAKTSAWWWCRGIAKKTFTTDEDSFGRYVTVEEIGFKIEEVPGRQIGDLIILQVGLFFKKPSSGS